MKTERINAEKARDISRDNDPSLAVEQILAGIEVAAKEGQYEYRTNKFGFGSSNCYAGEDKYSVQCKAILRELRSLGFKANVKSCDGQFTNIWLSVTWDSEG